MIISELVFWGCFGLIVEICFTSIKNVIIKRELNFIGHTSLIMFPIYSLGLSYGFDFILWLIEENVIRYLSYPLWIWLVEIIVGIPLRKKNILAWDYNYLPSYLHWNGIISFVHYPLWVLFGILVETIKSNVI